MVTEENSGKNGTEVEKMVRNREREREKSAVKYDILFFCCWQCWLPHKNVNNCWFLSEICQSTTENTTGVSRYSMPNFQVRLFQFNLIWCNPQMIKWYEHISRKINNIPASKKVNSVNFVFFFGLAFSERKWEIEVFGIFIMWHQIHQVMFCCFNFTFVI